MIYQSRWHRSRESKLLSQQTAWALACMSRTDNTLKESTLFSDDDDYSFISEIFPSEPKEEKYEH